MCLPSPNGNVPRFSASVHGPNKQTKALSNNGSPLLRSVTPQSALRVIQFPRFCPNRGVVRGVQKSSNVPFKPKWQCTTLQSQCPWPKQTDKGTQKQWQSIVTERHTSICTSRDPVSKILPESGRCPRRSKIKQHAFQAQMAMYHPSEPVSMAQTNRQRHSATMAVHCYGASHLNLHFA